MNGILATAILLASSPTGLSGAGAKALDTALLPTWNTLQTAPVDQDDDGLMTVLDFIALADADPPPPIDPPAPPFTPVTISVELLHFEVD